MKSTKGTRRKYDWGALFKRKRFTLEYGKDFSIRAKAMAQQLRNAASAREVGIKIEIVEPTKTHNVRIKVEITQ